MKIEKLMSLRAIFGLFKTAKDTFHYLVPFLGLWEAGDAGRGSGGSRGTMVTPTLRREAVSHLLPECSS